MENFEVLDVLIIGAGLSGIDAAYRLQAEHPGKTFKILEARPRIGGTWDLFRYPGVRSDSDIETLGFPFKPWDKEKSIADGASIRTYIEETARQFGIDQKISFGCKAQDARWDQANSCWSVAFARADGEKSVLRSRFLYLCTGYYNYGRGHSPRWKDIESFKGQVIHPQFWPEEFNPEGKEIVVVGSGATAVTIVPALAEKATMVTMLQRTPTYIVSRPSVDPLTKFLRTVFPKSIAPQVVRLKNILFGIGVYQLAKKCPDQVRKSIKRMARKEVPPEVDVEKDFNPPYAPWDQRLCLTPDADLFEALRSGRAKIETDEIEGFLSEGLRLKSGKILTADVVVTATGLELQVLGGMNVFVGEKKIDLSQHHLYKGLFVNDLPNFAFSLGYTNASWTLKCDLTARYFCRVLSYMEKHSHRVVWPVFPEGAIESESLIDLSSGYIKRSEAKLPKQGSKTPWRLHQNYFFDWLDLEFCGVDDAYMKFSGHFSGARVS